MKDEIKVLTFDNFKKLLSDYQKLRESIDVIFDNGIDITTFIDPFYSIIDNCFSYMFTKYGFDWINWFLFERPSLKKDGYMNKAWDENNNEICYDEESLWNYLKDNDYIIVKYE